MELFFGSMELMEPPKPAMELSWNSHGTLYSFHGTSTEVKNTKNVHSGFSKTKTCEKTDKKREKSKSWYASSYFFE